VEKPSWTLWLSCSATSCTSVSIYPIASSLSLNNEMQVKNGMRKE
jgi:hypothetical protein